MKHQFSLGSTSWALAVTIGVVGSWSGLATAAGDAAAGAKKTMFCSACHGVDGNATLTGTPRLAGQSVEHFTNKMKIYKSGKVVYHPMMALLTLGLSDQDIADMAAFYASQKPQDSLKPPSSPSLP